MRICLVLLFVSVSVDLSAQIFIPEDNPVKIHNRSDKPLRAYGSSYFWKVLTDTAEQKRMKTQAKIHAEFYKKNKYDADNFVLLNAEPTQLFDSAGNFKAFQKTYDKTPGFTNGSSVLRFSTDSASSKLDRYFNLTLNSTTNILQFIQPFYFRKFEVTNKEYREFVFFIKDSLARKLLVESGYTEYGIRENSSSEGSYFKKKINWQNSDEDFKRALEPLYLPTNERFYNRHEIDTRKLNYLFYSNENGQSVKTVINVYPDTLSWMTDFPYGYNEPMTNMYFWHPAYNDYPVVGISWSQAKAYIHWKEEKVNRKLIAQNKPYRVSFDLPSETEWEMAASALENKGKPEVYAQNSNYLFDKSWLFDLYLSAEDVQSNLHSSTLLDSSKVTMEITGAHLPTDTLFVCTNGNANVREEYVWKDSSYFKVRREVINVRCEDQLYANMNLDERFQGNFVMDGYFHTGPANLDRLGKTHAFTYWKDGKIRTQILRTDLAKKNLDQFKISYMGGNVSEWLKEDCQDFRPAMYWRLQYLSKMDNPGAAIEYDLEKYFFTANDKGGKLVRGGNWFDERFSEKLGKNYSGMNLKKFVRPEESHCTVGFRYVIHLIPVKP